MGGGHGYSRLERGAEGYNFMHMQSIYTVFIVPPILCYNFLRSALS